MIFGFGGLSWPCGALFPLLIDGWSKSTANQDESLMTLQSTVMIHSYIISSKLAELSPSPHSLQQHQMCPLGLQAASVRHQWSSLSKRRQSDTWTFQLHYVAMLCLISKGCKKPPDLVKCTSLLPALLCSTCWEVQNFCFEKRKKKPSFLQKLFSHIHFLTLTSQRN